MLRFNLCILKNESQDDHELWIKACEDFSDIVYYDVIDLTGNDWYEKLISKKYDYLIAKPPGFTAKFKQLYDERIFIIDNVLKFPIYPTPIEIYIYENKRFLASWLKANNLPHPKTYCFYNKEEALNFLMISNYPIVAKFNIGASGSGVKILHSKNEASQYVEKSFSKTGAPKRWGPNLSQGNIIKRGLFYLKAPEEISKKISIYKARKEDSQSGFVILQEYIPHDFEWRIVVIGDSYFAHKKLKINEKASGSTLKNYDNPSKKLFDFAKAIMGKYGFNSQAIDIFETNNEKLLINEMQCMFGQSDPYQMLVNGKPGRYRYLNRKWIFEEGDFASNQCYDLRVNHILFLLKFSSVK